jgi:geranylgeranyl diphosphate synthase type I
VDVGAAIELVHAMALIHDDIMDGSVRRHGRTSVQVDFAAKHADRGWHGDGRRFGDGSAILIGDLAFVYADGLLRGAPPAVVDVFHDLRLEVNIGQYLDLVGTASRNALPDQARTIGVYKSGKYTVERPLHVGAALAGRLDELAKAYSAYGLPVGEAFQLRDDILGAFGDGQRLGKDVGADLRDGKPTLLYALARERARGSDATLLETRVGQPDLSPDEVTEVQRVMVTTGARADVEENIQELLDQGLAALAEAPVTEGAREELRALALFVTGRDF